MRAEKEKRKKQWRVSCQKMARECGGNMHPGTEARGVASHARSKDRCFRQGESKSHEDRSNGGQSQPTVSARQHVGPCPHTCCHSGVHAGAQTEGSASPPGSLPQAQSGYLVGTEVCAHRPRALCPSGASVQVLCSSQDSRCPDSLLATWLRLKGPLLCVSRSRPDD